MVKGKEFNIIFSILYILLYCYLVQDLRKYNKS